MRQQPSRIAPGTMVRIINTDPHNSGTYKLIHAGHSLVFWEALDGKTHCGAIVNDDFFQEMHNFYIDAMWEFPPLQEYGE